MSVLILASEAIAEASAGPWWSKTYPEFLGLNPSHVVFMMVPFWVSLISTWFLAIKPVMKVIEEREHRTEGARAEAAELEIKFNERLSAYETRLNETKQKAAEERQRIRKEAIAAEEKILSAARTDAAKELEKVRSAVEAERTRVRAELGTQAEALARELATKALGRDLGAAGTSPRAPQPGVRS
ncbi:MAG TPA: ATP synthase F0 subunit B [bacterium]|nr:ATP synthase F0 subunit B [bacterium]